MRNFLGLTSFKRRPRYITYNGWRIECPSKRDFCHKCGHLLEEGEKVAEFRASGTSRRYYCLQCFEPMKEVLVA